MRALQILTAPPPTTVNAMEVLANQFECPKVYIDAQLVSDQLECN